MAETYGFFNSQLVDGQPDRSYEATDFANYYAQLVGTGVFANPSTNLQVQPVSTANLTVKVCSGDAYIKGYWYKLSEDMTFKLSVNTGSVARYDAIILTLNLALRTIALSLVQGSTASSVPAPTLIRNSTQYQLCLAQVAVPPSSASIPITASMIYDRRSNSSYCGWVTGLIDQIDTTNLFAQFTDAWNTWFNNKKQEVKDFTLVTRYNNRVLSTSVNQTSFTIGIPEYDVDIDILNVYVNGMKLTPTTDYTNTQTTVTLSDGLDITGTPVEFEVFKSIDTEGVESVVSTVQQHTLQLGGMTLCHISPTAFNALVNKDPNTLYVVDPALEVT